MDALENLNRVAGSLQAIDLRTTSGDVRAQLREARKSTQDLGRVIADVLSVDVPVAPTLVAPREAQPA